MQATKAKVSDFKVAENFLRTVSKKLRIPFVDAPISFDDEPAHSLEASYNGEELVVGNTDRLGKTYLVIIANYLDAIDHLVGKQVGLSDEEKTRMVTTATAIIRDFMYSSTTLPEAWEKPYPSMSLSQFPFVWLVLRDIICPVKEAELKDIRVSLDRSPRHDAVSLGEATIAGVTEPVLFVNLEVESDVYRSAMLLTAAIKAYGLDPVAVITEMVNGDLWDKVHGFAKLAFVKDQDVHEFVFALCGSANVAPPAAEATSATKVWYKAAQVTGRYPGAEGFGFGMGANNSSLTEQLLDVSRGPDQQIKKILQPLTEKIWKRVSDEKERRGKADMSFEDMLRVHSKDFKVKPNTLLQGLLSAERIW
jgi:hypothetical protein